MKKPQVWFCDKCKSMGVLVYEEHTDAYEVVKLVRQQHRIAGGCIEQPRVLVLENVQETEIFIPSKIARYVPDPDDNPLKPSRGER